MFVAHVALEHLRQLQEMRLSAGMMFATFFQLITQ